MQLDKNNNIQIIFKLNHFVGCFSARVCWLFAFLITACKPSLNPVHPKEPPGNTVLITCKPQFSTLPGSDIADPAPKTITVWRELSRVKLNETKAGDFFNLFKQGWESEELEIPMSPLTIAVVALAENGKPIMSVLVRDVSPYVFLSKNVKSIPGGFDIDITTDMGGKNSRNQQLFDLVRDSYTKSD